MKAYVLIKQVPDTETKIKISDDKSKIDTADIKWIVNPYDEFALEDSLRLKESGKIDEIISISVGPSRVSDALRSTLAVGVDRSIHIECDEWCDPQTVAKLLAAALKSESYDGIILCGKWAIDDDSSQVPQFLAEELDIGHISVVLDYHLEGNKIVALREIEGGTCEKYEANLPLIVGAQKSMNKTELRYAKVPDILKAKKKEIKKMSPSELGVKIESKVQYFDFELPPQKAPIKMINGDPKTQAHELVKILREEAKII